MCMRAPGRYRESGVGNLGEGREEMSVGGEGIFSVALSCD